MYPADKRRCRARATASTACPASGTADVVDVRGFEAVVEAGRAAELAGRVSSSEKKRSASGSDFDATFGAGGVAAAFAVELDDFAVEDDVAEVRDAAVVVVDFGVVDVVDLAVVDLAAVLELVDPVALLRSFLTLLVTLLT